MNKQTTVDYHEGWANSPNLVIQVDRIPEAADFVYDEWTDGVESLFFAVDQETSCVSYFSYSGPGRGYGGHVFDLTMKDGSVKSLIGPWSSRCACMNEVGFPHSVEVVLVTPDGREHNFAILAEVAKEYLAASGEKAEFVFDSAKQVYHLQKV